MPRECFICKRGPSFHGGHDRSDPTCILFGCDSSDAGQVSSFLRNLKIEAASTPSSPSSSPGTPRTRHKALQKCLRGAKSHHKHNPTADNRVLYGVEDLTPAKAKRILFEQEIALARDEARSMALSSSATTPPSPASPPHSGQAQTQKDGVLTGLISHGKGQRGNRGAACRPAQSNLRH